MTPFLESETLSPQLLAEVQNAEKLLKRRLPIGSQISEKHVIDDFVKQGINEFAIRKAIQILVQRDELEYRNQRKRIYRRC
jgi:DNA replication licensing factor MCM5